MHSVLTAEMVEFNRLYRETDHIYARYAAAQGISSTALCVLYSLYISESPCTQAELVEDWGIPMQTINSCLKTMEKNGDVRMEFAEGSRKSKKILLTGQGRALTERIIVPLVEAENQALNALEDMERRQLMALNRKHSGLLRAFLFEEG